MKFEIVHRTHYQYASPVSESFNELRLQPTSSDGQNCHSFVLRILPATRLSHYLDFYLNFVHYFEVNEPHPSLSIEAISTVSTSRKVIQGPSSKATMDRVGECARLEQCYDFIQGSQMVSVGPEIWRMGKDALAGENHVWTAAHKVMEYVHREIEYVTDSTSVETHMTEAIAQKRGVCQDLAHVMIGICRSMRIPARYVSGYLYNGTADKLIGSQASHAWCEAFIPDLGWCSFDPTNNQQADDRYVKLAAGRDYADVAPVKGNYKGTPEKSMDVELRVTALES